MSEYEGFDIIEELKESYRNYGPIRKIKRTQFGIVAGETRKMAVPEWPEDPNVIQVKSYLDHLKIKAADNIAAPKKPEWWTALLTEAATEIEKQGTEKGEIASKLAEEFSISKRRVYRYLPSEFKANTSPVGPREKSDSVSLSSGEPAKEDSYKPAPVQKVPYSKGQSSSLNANNPSMFTQSHLSLFMLINKIKGTNFLNEEPFERKGELTKDGKPKSFQTDCVDRQLKLVVEAMGEGSSSDDPKRDAYFEKEGYELLKFSNEEIKAAPRLVKLSTVLTVENIKLRWKLAEARSE